MLSIEFQENSISDFLQKFSGRKSESWLTLIWFRYFYSDQR